MPRDNQAYRGNKQFGDWNSDSNDTLKSLSKVALPDSRNIYLIDKPNAQQSYIVAGQLLPPSATDEEIKLSYMKKIFALHAKIF